MTAATLLDRLRRRGVALRVAGGKLEVRPSGRLTAVERGAIRAHLPELMALLACGAWDRDAALRGMEDADARVERLGVSGTAPEVRAAASAVAAAYAARDSAGFGAALTAFRGAVAQLAGVRNT